MSKTKDLFPQDLKEAKRYRRQKKQLTKVMAKQRLEEEYSDEAVNFVLDIIRDEGPTNFLGVWIHAKEKIGEESFEENNLYMDLSVIIILLHGAGQLWKYDFKNSDACVFGIIGEQSKKEYISSLE